MDVVAKNALIVEISQTVAEEQHASFGVVVVDRNL
jgi:hypothetical protein